MRIRSLRSPLPTWLLRKLLRFSCSSCLILSYTRVWRSFRACCLFWIWERSSWHVTTIPVGNYRVPTYMCNRLHESHYLADDGQIYNSVIRKLSSIIGNKMFCTWVIRTAESVVLTCCPPAPLDRYVSMLRMLHEMWLQALLGGQRKVGQEYGNAWAS